MPTIGRSKEDFERILAVTGADGVMVGRASFGQPEFFAELNGNKMNVNKFEQIRFHYETMLKYYAENYVVKYMRSHLAGYLKGKYKNTEALVKLLKMEKYEEIIEFLGEILV